MPDQWAAEEHCANKPAGARALLEMDTELVKTNRVSVKGRELLRENECVWMC